MSVVVISHNDAHFAARSLNSLLAQDYPHDRYEIIFVNDGSTDDTRALLLSYPAVRYIELPSPQGIAASRNAGLRVATGEVYICFDSDCLAATDWLTALAAGYQLTDPAGVGGVLVGFVPPVGIVAKYLSEVQSRAPRPVDDRRPSAVRRLLDYLQCDLHGVAPATTQSEVTELYGANCSFPVEVLRAVSGWDVTMGAPLVGGIEDRDLCHRIRLRFPGRRFYTMSAARIGHAPSTSFRGHLSRLYSRGPFAYRFHAEHGLLPPVFPFPLIVLTACVAGAVTAGGPLPLILMVALPPSLYFWWPVRAARERDWSYLAFPYLQCLEESVAGCALVRGALIRSGFSYRTARTTMYAATRRHRSRRASHA